MTSKTGYTPGPWEIHGREIWSGGGEHVVRIANGKGSYDEKDAARRKANARLIAAAPTEDAALRRLYGAVMNWRERGYPDLPDLTELSAACEDARAILAKIEGE